MEILTFYAITFKQIKIQKRLALQNDRPSLSFVKDTYLDAKKWLETVVKWWFMIRKFWDSPSKFKFALFCGLYQVKAVYLEA